MHRTFVGRLSSLLLFLVVSSLAHAGNDSWTPLRPEGGRPTQLLADGSTSYLVSGNRIYSSADAGDSWSLLTELPSGIASVAVDGTTMFAGTYYNGVMRSQDAGSSWETVGLDHEVWLEDLHVEAIVIGQDSANTIYAGTSEGLYLSIDDGNTWTTAGAPLEDRQVFAVAVHPLNTEVAYAGTDNGMFCTTNAGASWASCSINLPTDGSFYISTIEIAPSPPFWVFAGSFNAKTVYASDNNGSNWFPLAEGPHNLIVSGALRDIAFDPNDRAKAYAVFDSLADDAAPLFRSIDGGSEWSAIGKPEPGKHGPDGSAVTVLDDGSLLVGTARGVYQVENDGSSWVLSNGGFDNAPVNHFAIAPDGSGKIVAVARNVYPYMSTDGGDTWQNVTTDLPHPDFYTAEFNPANSSELWLGQAFDEGLFKSVNGGSNWTMPSVGMTSATPAVQAIAIDAMDPDHVVITESNEGEIHVTWDGGVSWAKASDDVPSGTDARELLISPDNSQTVYFASTAGLYKSTDGGESWSEAGVGENTGEPVLGLALAPADSNTVYASLEAGIFRSNDAGVTWTHIYDSLAGGIIAIDPADGSRLLLANHNGLYASTSGGEGWQEFNKDLPMGATSSFISDVQFDPTVRNRYYVAADDVLYVLDGALPETASGGPDDDNDNDGGDGDDNDNGGGGTSNVSMLLALLLLRFAIRRKS